MSCRLTDRKAWIKSALTEARGFPLTRMVYVSSRSLPISVPNQERFVNSGEDSGVRLTSSPEKNFSKKKKKYIYIDILSRVQVLRRWRAKEWLQVPIKWKLGGNKSKMKSVALIIDKVSDEMNYGCFNSSRLILFFATFIVSWENHLYQ